MIIIIIILFSVLCIAIGRITFGQWFNHISLYSSIWGLTLTLFEARFINYYQLELETWLVIFVCWSLFILGSVLVAVIRGGANKFELIRSPISDISHSRNLKQLKILLWVLNVITLIVAIRDLYTVSEMFGSLTNALVLGNLLYKYRVSESLPGSIPFIGSLTFPAAMLAGIYTSLKKRISFVAIMPLIIIIMINLTKMGRVDILMGTLLFISGYYLTPKVRLKKTKNSNSRIKNIAMGFILLLIIIGGAELIRSTRNIQEQFVGTTKGLQDLGKAGFITPSIYLYLSSEYGILNQYIKHGGENTPIGGHTFLPFYRWIENIGGEIHAKPFQGWYKTPVRTNTGTYLRELHGDFGMAGLLFGPFLLGLLSSVFWFRVKDNGRYVDIAVTAFFYVIVGMSFFVMATRQGQLITYLVTATIFGIFLDGLRKKFSPIRDKK